MPGLRAPATHMPYFGGTLRTVSQLVGGALVLDSPRFEDDRGTFAVPFEMNAAVAAGLPDRFVQDNQSLSYQVGTVRGIHLQLPPYEQGKLIRVLRGRIFDVVVDLRPGSPTVGEVASVELGSNNGNLVWVPAGFGHGFCTLEPDTEVFYKVDAAYRPDAELSVAWDDPTLGISWPVEPGAEVLSDKDQNGITLSEALAAIRMAS